MKFQLAGGCVCNLYAHVRSTALVLHEAPHDQASERHLHTDMVEASCV